MEIGDRIGNYTLTKTLGVGGFATVFAAEHRQIGTRHAVKVLHPHFARNPRVVERFKQEARAQFKMRHPNIVQVTEFVQQGSAIALVMDLIDGETLHAAMQRRPRPWPTDDVMAVIKPVLEAMAYAHRTGIDGAPVVHRDLKPENVLLDYAATEGVFPGVPKVADFGIAKVLGDSAVGTATGARMGTPGYMAPEQFRNAKDVARVADVWALGMMLWQLLAGRLPVDPEDNIAVLKLYEGLVPVPRLVDVVAGVPKALSDAVAQALVVDPAERFADALPLLRAVGFGFSQVPAPAPTARHFPQWSIVVAEQDRNRPVGRVQIDALPLVGRNTVAYFDNGDGTIWDPVLGKTWQKGDSGCDMAWHEANGYAAGLRLGGYDDWRLPTAFELLGLVDNSRKKGDRIAIPFHNSQLYFWTASPFLDAEKVWLVYFFYGQPLYSSKTERYRVRCVR